MPNVGAQSRLRNSTQMVTEPPAFSIASTADFEAPATSKVELRLSSPTPRIFTPSRGFDDHAGGHEASRP